MIDISSFKNSLLKTNLYKALLWIRYTKKIGLKNQGGGPSSGKDKQEVVKKIAQKNKIKVLVETGTYLGDMIFANLKTFERIYSIEVNKKLYDRAKNRFKKDNHVKILLGNSGKLLGQILGKVKTKTVFWLDAHYSGGITSGSKDKTPIELELKEILKNWRHGNIILIDDADLFNGSNNYPTINTIKKLTSPKNLNIKLVKNIILIK